MNVGNKRKFTQPRVQLFDTIMKVPYFIFILPWISKALDHEHHPGELTFFVPSFKPAASVAVSLFQGHFRYGLQGYSTQETRQALVDHHQHLMKVRLDFAWISSANIEYQQALASILFLSNIHAQVLGVHSLSKKLEPESQVEDWCNHVLNGSSSSAPDLVQSLAALNQIIQGLNTKHGISILGPFKEHAQPEQDRSVCQQVHQYRDYLTGLQIQGYALLSTCFNVQLKHDIVHVLTKVGHDRLMQQQRVLGGYYNDWYEYGKASCSYQIRLLRNQSQCLTVVPDEPQLFNDYLMPKIDYCKPGDDPLEGQQWIYNKVSWQLVTRSNQSQCLQKLFDGYNVGNPIVLKECHRHPAQV